MLDVLKQGWAVTGGLVLGAVPVLMALFIKRVRLDRRSMRILLRMIQEEGYTLASAEPFMLVEEEINELKAFCRVQSMWFRLQIEERLLQAGGSGVDVTCYLTVMRWNLVKLRKIVQENWELDKRPEVFLLHPWFEEKVAELDDGDPPIPLMDREIWGDPDEEEKKVFAGEKRRSGVILHGPPGNGKSFFVRYLAMQYRVPIYAVVFVPDYTNLDLIRMFQHVKGPGIVLLEDFDAYFDGRESRIPAAKFTFDAVLNVLDGVFTEPKGLFFVMTANDLSKIDPALKNRPSRFKFVREVTHPSYEVRERILGSDRALETGGMSLDKVLYIEDRIEVVGFEKALEEARSLGDESSVLTYVPPVESAEVSEEGVEVTA